MGNPSQLKAISEKFSELYRQKVKLKAELTETNKALMALQPKFVGMLDEAGLQNFNMPELGTFYIAEDLVPKVEDEEALLADLKSRRLGSLIKKSINWQTLKATIKDLIGQNKPLLKGVTVTNVRNVRLLGGKDGE